MGDKGDSGVSSYNYYGSLIAAVCAGPVDTLHVVIVDGKQVVSGPIGRSVSGYQVITGSVEAKYLHSGGKMVIFWGTSDQDISAQFTGGVFDAHPDYRGVCVLAVTGLLFGRERTTAPNIEVVVSRKPVADTSLVSSAHNVLDDGQCNPVAALVELLTSQNGLGIPVARFEADEWLAAAAYCATDPDRTFCSPLVAQQQDSRKIISDLLAMFDGVLYWTPSGTLGLTLLEPGTNPGSLATLDAQHITERARIDGAGWTEVPTCIQVRHPDRDASYKLREAKQDNLLALRSRGQTNPMVIERPHVTRADQAALIAAESARRTARPPGRVELSVRRYHASGMLPGTKVLVDLDPEPGGVGSAQLCVVRERRDEALGPVKLTLVPDTLVEATPYSPVFVSPNPQAAACPPIAADDAMAVPLPPVTWGAGKVAILVPRPDALVIGFRIGFAVDTDSDGNLDDEDWADLGYQVGFACRMILDEDLDDDETTVDLTLAGGANGPDAYLAARLPANERDAEQDNLLLILANLDSNDRVKLTDGHPEMEICSVITRTAVDADTHTYTVLRARRGTSARAWQTSGSPRAYVLPAANVVAWSHQIMTGLVASGEPGFLRLVAYTADVEDDTIPVPQVSFAFPTAYHTLPVIEWTAPSGSQGTTDGSGNYTPDVSVTDADGDLISVRVDSLKTDGTGYVARYTATFAPAGVHQFSGSLNFASGAHTLTVTAMDAAGNVTTGSRTIVNAGSGLLPPTYSPLEELEFMNSLTVTLTVVSPADQVQWAVAAIGSGEPSSWSSTTPGDLTRNVTLTSSKRLWSRARRSSDGVVSAATFGDYWKNVG